MKIARGMLAVLAGAMAAFISGAADAATMDVTYTVDIPFASGLSLTGAIVTNGISGSLTTADIVSYDLFFDNIETTNNNSTLSIIGTSFIASGSTLEFSPQQSGDRVMLSGDPINARLLAASVLPQTTVINVSEYGISFGTAVVLNRPAVVGAVPLPPSAPMFGAALLGLAGFRWAIRRKGMAAA